MGCASERDPRSCIPLVKKVTSDETVGASLATVIVGFEARARGGMRMAQNPHTESTRTDVIINVHRGRPATATGSSHSEGLIQSNLYVVGGRSVNILYQVELVILARPRDI